jgi:tetratricopeptide (TPR) repeat protein
LGLVVSLWAGNLLQGAPADLPQLRTQLTAAEKAEDKDAIVELSRRILESAPTESQTWEKLARTQVAIKDFERCKTTLDRWEQAVKPRPAAIDDLRGDVASEQEDYKSAEAHWRAFIAAKPGGSDAADTYKKLANLCVDQSRWRENLEFRSRIIELKDDAPNRVERATVFLRLHRWDEAYIDINKANGLDPSNATVKEWFPQFERLQKFLPRIKELDAQIAKSPNDAALLLDQARIFTLADRPLLAQENAEKALKLQPASMRARIQTAEAFLDNHQTERAAELKVSSNLVRAADHHVAEKVLTDLAANDALLLQNSKNADALAERAKILYELKQPALALPDAQAALAINDKLAAAQFDAAHISDELGQKKEALAHARTATELDPNDWIKWAYRGTLEKERADFPAAIESQTRSLKLRETVLALSEREQCERRIGKVKEADADANRIHELPASHE